LAAPADDAVRVLEVQGRTVQPRVRTALAAAAVAAAALVIVAAQPYESPWWTYADADATYVASGLNLLAGERTQYLDHPGLPLQELLEASFAVGWMADGSSRREFARDVLLDLDAARGLFRGLGAAFYVAGAVLTVLACASLFGGALWGLAGGLLWLGGPGLAAMSIQYRPDVLLAGLCVLVLWLILRAAASPSAERYALAAAALGLAATVKIHAAGLLPALILAVLWRRPRDAFEWWPPLWALGAWAAAVVLLNANNVPFTPTAEQLAAGAALAAAFVFTVLVRRTLPAAAATLGGLAIGVALPVSLNLRDGLQALVVMARGLVGGGVNTGVEPFTGTLDDAWNRVPHFAFLVFALAAAAAVAGVLRREPAPGIVFAAAAALAAMALARFADTHYFAPAYAVSILGALWLARSLPVGGAALALVFAFAISGFALSARGDPAHDRDAFRERAAPELNAALARAGNDEVVLTPSYWPAADTRFYEVVAQYTALAPDYPYRTLPASDGARRFARERGLEICCAVGGAEP
jgi:hypothetical protein